MHVSLGMKRRIEVELFVKLGSREKNLGTFVCFFLKEVICWGMRRSKGSVGNKEIREMCSVFSMTRASEDFYALMLEGKFAGVRWTRDLQLLMQSVSVI